MTEWMGLLLGREDRGSCNTTNCKSRWDFRRRLSLEVRAGATLSWSLNHNYLLKVPTGVGI